MKAQRHIESRPRSRRRAHSSTARQSFLSPAAWAHRLAGWIKVGEASMRADPAISKQGASRKEAVFSQRRECDYIRAPQLYQRVRAVGERD